MIRSVFKFLASYGFAVILLLFLLILTYLGTIEQVEHGLYATQEKYFNSLFLIHEFGPVPVPLPGAYLLLILFSINLICGGILRAPKGWSHAGILIAHAGIILMLAGSFVTFKYSINGHLSLYEGFNIPLLEAMHVGTPALVSDIAPHREVAGDAATYLDVTDEESMAQAIKTFLQNKDLQSEMSKRGQDRAGDFSWENTAQILLDLYNEIRPPRDL